MTDLIERLRAKYGSAQGSDLDCEAANMLEHMQVELDAAWVAVLQRGEGVKRLEAELAEARKLIQKAFICCCCGSHAIEFRAFLAKEQP